jgi:hypothetical protein
MRLFLISAALAFSAPALANEPVKADAAPAAPAAAEKAAAAYSVETSSIGDLLDNPAAKAILDKHLPGATENPQFEMARPMTLRAVQQFAPDQFTDERLSKIEADLKALPAKS